MVTFSLTDIIFEFRSFEFQRTDQLVRDRLGEEVPMPVFVGGLRRGLVT
jgi:hypothetical protein